MTYNRDSDEALGKSVDVYQVIDATNKSVNNLERFFEDAKNNDPEFYEELKEIFNGNKQVKDYERS